MVSNTPNSDVLLPIRHPQGDLFLCDIGDCILKSDLGSMEHPIFSLSKKPDLKQRIYQNGDNRLVVTPSIKGLATIYDADLLKFATSQLIAAKNAGRPISRELRMSARSFLIFANRCTGGSDYEGLEAALVRLRGTTVQTNIVSGGVMQTKVFGLLDSASVERKDGFGRVLGLRLELSQWLFNAIDTLEVLSLSKDYFLLKKATDRRIYEIVRKHCGKQKEWTIGVEKLHRKSGSRRSLKQFRHYMKELARTSHLPDYQTCYNLAADTFTFLRRGQSG